MLKFLFQAKQRFDGWLQGITFTSHVKHRLGTWFVGTAESMSVADDFYFEKCDRAKPKKQDINEPPVYMDRMATAHFRLNHGHRVTKLMAWGQTLPLIVLIVVLGGYAGADKLYQNHKAKVAADQALEDQKTQTHCNTLTADQQKADSECTDLAARQLADRKQKQKDYWAKQCAAMPADNRARSPYCNGQLPEIQ